MANAHIRASGIEGPEEAEQVRQALQSVFGVQEVSVNSQSGNIAFSYDERSASFRDFKHAVIDAGYQVIDDGESSRIEEERIGQ